MNTCTHVVKASQIEPAAKMTRSCYRDVMLIPA